MTPPAAWTHLRFFAEAWPEIRAALRGEARIVLPPGDRVFAALDLCPPDAVRVVILGQDPYPQAGKADGLAFSIPDHYPRARRDSLSVILSEVSTDMGAQRHRTDLTDWARQGVLLLNTALTVPEGVANGHARLGWRRLVSEVLADVSRRRPTAFLLWGGKAQAFRAGITGDGHLILEARHPSPLNAKGGFRGTQPFSQVNEWLRQRQERPIDWIGG